MDAAQVVHLVRGRVRGRAGVRGRVRGRSRVGRSRVVRGLGRAFLYLSIPIYLSIQRRSCTSP